MKATQTGEQVSLAGAIVLGLASSLCCVLPFVLVSIGATGPWLARLQVFEPYRIPIDLASIAVLTIAWLTHAVLVRSCASDGCALPRRIQRTRIALVTVTAVILAIMAAPYAIARFGGV